MSVATKSVKDFLRNNYVDGIFHTHVSMIQPKGRFLFNREGLESFWELYHKSDEVLGIAEMPQTYIPVLVDVDLKVKLEDGEKCWKNGEHLYTQTQVEQIVKIYQSVLRSTVEDCEDKHLLCVLLEKPIRYDIVFNTKTKEETVYVKNGFHLHFPHTFLNRNQQDTQIIPRVQKLVKEADIFGNLGLHDETKIIDNATVKNPWLLYGSRKSEDMDPYKITKIYDKDMQEISVREAFDDYVVYDRNEDEILVKDNIEKYLPQILSISPYGRTCSEFKNNLESPLKEEIKQRKPKVKKEFKPIGIEKKIENIKKLLQLLTDARSENHGDWLKIGWIIHKETEACDEGFELWNEFSSRCDEKYDEDECRDKWDKMEEKKDGVSMGTLHYYAKTDSPELYKDIMAKEHTDKVDDCMNGSHADFAELYQSISMGMIKIVNKKNGTFYHWHKTKLLWKEESSDTLMRLIGEEIKPLLIAKCQEVMKSLSNCDKAEEAMYSAKIKQIYKCIANLRSTPFLKNIVTFFKTFDIDEEFRKKMNKRKDALPICGGKIIELKTGEVRLRTPEDIFSFELKINYIEKCSFANAKKFFNEISVNDEEMVDFHRRLWGYSLTGETCDRSLYTMYGEGKNGKSTLINIIKKILGDFYGVLDECVMTKTSISRGATPELAPLVDARVATLPESEEGETINSKRLKTITGDDTITMRKLYEDQMSFETQAKCFMPTNHKPKININDSAVVDRIKFIPFTARFEETPENVKYISDIYEKHLDEFFSFFVSGAVDWYGGKELKPAKCMLDEKAEYLKDQDTIADFLEQTFEPLMTEEEYNDKPKTEKADISKIKKSQCIAMVIEYNLTNNVKMSKSEITSAFKRLKVLKKVFQGNDFYILKEKEEEENLEEKEEHKSLLADYIQQAVAVGVPM